MKFGALQNRALPELHNNNKNELIQLSNFGSIVYNSSYVLEKFTI